MSLNAMLQESELESNLTISPTSAWTEGRPRPVVVTGIRIPFGSAVALLLKWTIAAIPAALLLSALVAAAFVVTTEVLPDAGIRLIP